jgi:hypothetical protein
MQGQLGSAKCVHIEVSLGNAKKKRKEGCRKFWNSGQGHCALFVKTHIKEDQPVKARMQPRGKAHGRQGVD